MPSDISQSQRDNTTWFHLHAVSKVVKFVETGSTVIVAGAVGRGERELLFDRPRVSVLQDEKVLEVRFSAM